MALGFLGRAGYTTLEGSTAATRRARLTAKGTETRARLPDVHERVERAWRDRFGDDDVDRLRAALGSVLEHPGLRERLRPPANGWRVSRPYRARTDALLEDPRAALQHYPLVLHRGGWPDGS